MPLFSKEHEIDKIETLKDDMEGELLHIVNFRPKKGSRSPKKGFVVMSADKRADPILAWSDENSFELSGEIPPAVALWLEYAKEVVKLAKKDKEPNKQALAAWQRLDRYIPRKNGRIAGCGGDPDCGSNPPQGCPPGYQVVVNPLTNPLSRCGQGPGYNNAMWSRSCGDCGKAAVGCGAVAVGMILRYDQRPSTGYNFGIMPASIPRICSGLTTGQQEVARLLYNVAGAMASSNAASCQTFTMPTLIQDGFAWAGYSQVGSSTSNLGLIENELTLNRPVLMSGTMGPLNLNDSQYWVCDGMNKSFYCMQVQPGTGISGSDCFCWGNTVYHMNWGWDNQFNGWFSITNLAPNPDKPNEVFSHWLRARVGVRP